MIVKHSDNIIKNCLDYLLNLKFNLHTRVNIINFENQLMFLNDNLLKIFVLNFLQQLHQ